MSKRQRNRKSRRPKSIERRVFRGQPITGGSDIQPPSRMNRTLHDEMVKIFNSPENWKRIWED